MAIERMLESGTARLLMRCQPALDDARPDTMAQEFAGGEQCGRAGPHDEDARNGRGSFIWTRCSTGCAKLGIDVGHCL